MPFNLNYSDIPASGIPKDGDWPAAIKEAYLKPNNAKDGLNLMVVYEFTSHEYAGLTTTKWWSLKGRAVGLAYEFLVNIGAIESGKPLKIEEDPRTLVVINPKIINKPCILRMGPQEGTDYSEIKMVFGPSGELKPKAESLREDADAPPRRPTLR